MDKREELFNKIVENLPPIVIRSRVYELTFGLVSAKTMSNSDVAGEGPKETSKLYGKIVYSKSSFTEWLKQQLFKNEE